jgi:hypothetical protein
MPDLIGHRILRGFKMVDYEISTFVEMTLGVLYCLLKPDKARVMLYKRYRNIVFRIEIYVFSCDNCVAMWFKFLKQKSTKL